MSQDGPVTIASTFSGQSGTLIASKSNLRAKASRSLRGLTMRRVRPRSRCGCDPTEYVLIFGNPKAGTPLMQDNQTTGIDLPLKILGWQDADRKVLATYNDPGWLGRRHHLGRTRTRA